MSGCFGPSNEDRQRERQLDKYLSELEQRNVVECHECGRTFNLENDEGKECGSCKTLLCNACAGTWHDDYYADCYKTLNEEDPQAFPLKGMVLNQEW